MNVTALDDALDDTHDVWFDGYDAANRLTQAAMTEGTAFVRTDWTYDKVGNRLTEARTPPGGTAVTDTYLYASTSNRLTTVSQGTTILRSLAYTASGAVSSSTEGTVTTAYGYDGPGRLRTVTVGGVLKGTELAPIVPSFITRIRSGSGPSWTGLRSRSG